MSSVADTLDGLSRSPPSLLGVQSDFGRESEQATRIDLCFDSQPVFAFLVLLLLRGDYRFARGGSLPALRTFGLGFIASPQWNPVTEQFGALVPIVGTLVTSFIALLIGLPVSFGIALFLTELCRPGCATLGHGVELLAAIPSIIYGMWGCSFFAPPFSSSSRPLGYSVDRLGVRVAIIFPSRRRE